MNYLAIAQFMAASAFLTMGMIHALIWLRAHREVAHLLFALTAAAAGTNAIAEQFMYRSDSIELMGLALRWYVSTSGLWLIATICFIAAYAGVGRIGRSLVTGLVVVLSLALIANLFSPTSFLYSEITGLREIPLPWGENIWLAVGISNPFRLAAEFALVFVVGLAADGCYQFWKRGQKKRALYFGAAVFLFLACFGTHAWLVDTGRLNSPYLSTYGFLALAFFMSYEIAGKVIRSAELSSELAELEDELHSAVEDERNRIAGDLHDSVTQTLFSTAAIADALPEVWKRSPDQAFDGLLSLKHLTRGALAEMRTLLLELRPAALLKKDLGELLQQLAEAVSGRTRVPVDVQCDCTVQFPDDVQITLYRIVQEALNNCMKHSRADQIWLELTCEEAMATLRIRDNGRGFELDDPDSNGIGLEIMEERVKSIGGTLDIQSAPGEGALIMVQWSELSYSQKQ